MLRARTIIIIYIAASVLMGVVLGACSTSKNTSGTRFYHSVTARFNVMYNGKTAYNEGVEAQQKGHKDDYTSLLPMYIPSDTKTAAMGKSNFETAITKAEKAIKKHSIKRKPKKPKGRMSDKQKAYFARNEFNPYIHNSWMLLANAQFRTGDFIEAAATYSYIARLYQNQPEVSGVARARTALCYVLMEWPYDAEDLLRKLERDSLASHDTGCRRAINATRAAFYIATEQYAEAIPMLRSTVPHAKPKLQRARLYYLLGQLCAQVGDKNGAYKALSKCIRLNPPYELAFNARIMQTEVMAEGQGKAMIRKLMRMTKNPNNADYLDRIYYAIGNIHLASRDTMRAIYAWEKGIEESTQNGYAKAIVLQHLGELQWDRADYIKAAPCYTELASLMSKERDEYAEVQRRSKILTEIEPHLSAVKLQDSLQVLAKLPEKEYLAAIDRVISDLKKKEREAERKAEAQGIQNRPGATANPAGATQRPTATTSAAGARRGNQNATFYFYTPQTVSQGRQEFQRKWGQRANEDNWRFSSKQGLGGAEASDADLAQADSLSLGEDEAISEEEQARLDSLANDPHEREYYLRQIPFTEEQLAASNELIRDGLYNGGVLLQDKVENFDLAHKTLIRLLNDFPDFDKKDDVYYHLFLLAMRRGETDQMQTYLTLMCDSFPDSKLTRTISHPRFIELAQNGRHLEDSLYAATYDAYKAGLYDEVDRNFAADTTDFEGGAHAGKFLFIHAMTQLYTGHQDKFLEELKLLTQKYSSDEIAEMAKYIVQGISDGRLLNTDKWDASNIWSMHSIAADTDSTTTDTLVAEVEKPFVFVLAYPTGELDENQLVYEVAAYNFTTFQARNFDISTTRQGVISQLRVSGFKSYDEVHLYAQQLYGDAHMRTLLEGIRIVLISEENLRLLGTKYSYDDYTEFFDENLSTRPVSEELILDEPTDLPTVDPEDVPAPNENDTVEGEESEEDADSGGNDDEDWLW